MGLFLRGYKGKWRIYWMSYSVGGRQIRESTGTSNKRLAQRILDARLGEVAERRWNLPSSNSPRLKDWVDWFLETVSHKKTKDCYKSATEYLLKFFGEKTKLAEISASRIEAFKQHRLASGVKPATVNRNLSVLRRMLNLAFRQRLIGRNPFEGVEFLPELGSRRQPHILNYQDQEKLLGAANSYLRVLIVLIAETGLRVNREALALKWEDVDFAKSQITIRESKTLAGRRIIPMSQYCKTELLAWKSTLGQDSSIYVFPNPGNPETHLQSVKKTWATTLRNAGLKHFPIYNLRHTFASRLNSAGASPLTIAHVLGHSGLGILQTYAKVVADSQREAIKKLEQARGL